MIVLQTYGATNVLSSKLENLLLTVCYALIHLFVIHPQDYKAKTSAVLQADLQDVWHLRDKKEMDGEPFTQVPGSDVPGYHSRGNG